MVIRNATVHAILFRAGFLSVLGFIARSDDTRDLKYAGHHMYELPATVAGPTPCKVMAVVIRDSKTNKVLCRFGARVHQPHEETSAIRIGAGPHDTTSLACYTHCLLRRLQGGNVEIMAAARHKDYRVCCVGSTIDQMVTRMYLKARVG